MRISGLDALRSGVLVALTATATFSLDVPPGLAAPTVNSRPAARSRTAGPPIVLARRFDADYEDALHPLCERHIRVDTSQPAGSFGGWIAHFYGTDVGPPGIGQKVSIACDEENIKRYTLREWEFDAKISPDGISIDAGDGVHVGQWREQTPAKDGTTWSGIRWADGNKWVVKLADSNNEAARSRYGAEPNAAPGADPNAPPGPPADMPSEIAMPVTAVPMGGAVPVGGGAVPALPAGGMGASI